MLQLQQRLNDLDLTLISLKQSVIDTYTKGVESSLKRHINPREQYTGLRLSQIGKPAVLQALWGIGFCHDGGIALKQRITFHIGDWFESFLVILLEAAGYRIVDHNNNTLFHEVVDGDKRIVYQEVPGHSDLVVESPEGDRFIIEAKTANDRYYTSFMESPDDERGYVSQLALYEKCFDLSGCWVFFNKNTSEIGVQFLTDEIRKAAVDRANKIIPILTGVRNFKDLSDLVAKGALAAPPPIPEVYRRGQTGAYLVPPSMKFTRYRHCFYDIVTEPNGYGKQTEYVVSVKDKIVHPIALEMLEEVL